MSVVERIYLFTMREIDFAVKVVVLLVQPYLGITFFFQPADSSEKNKKKERKRNAHA